MDDHERKQLETLDIEAFEAVAVLEKLKGSSNALSADPVKRKQQFMEVREARMAVKVSAMKVSRYMDHLALLEATEAVDKLIKDGTEADLE